MTKEEIKLRKELKKLEGWWLYVQPHNREDVEIDIRKKIKEINQVTQDKIYYDSFIEKLTKRTRRGYIKN